MNAKLSSSTPRILPSASGADEQFLRLHTQRRFPVQDPAQSLLHPLQFRHSERSFQPGMNPRRLSSSTSTGTKRCLEMFKNESKTRHPGKLTLGA